jgi:hypothetical protein
MFRLFVYFVIFRLFRVSLYLDTSPPGIIVTGPFTVDNLITGAEPPNSIRVGLSHVLADSLHCGARHVTGECFEVSTRTGD